MGSDTPAGDQHPDHQRLHIRDTAVYISIIEAIAGGANRLNDISTVIRASTAKTSVYMRSLIELRIVEKITPIGEKRSKKTLYRIADDRFAFYYRFISPYLSAIEQGLGSYVYDEEVQRNLSSCLGFIFEQVCTAYLVHRNTHRRLPFLLLDIGTWRGTDQKTDRDGEAVNAL
jgi:uncharacterized protein